MDKPNIVYFVCHDLGRHLGIYNALVDSPNIDAFARSGAIFTQAFCNSPCCSPSRACAMTGRYAHQTGAIGLSHMGWSLPRSESTIIDYLKAGGYETAHAGLAHERLPGENNYDVEMETCWDDWNAHRAVDHASDYLKERDNDKPFYLNIGTQQVHEVAWKRCDELYGGSVPPEDVYVPSHIPDNEVSRRELGKFQASIRYLDEQFRRLLDAIEACGYADNTIVVFTTDHGISGLRSKGTLYDTGTEIALIVGGANITYKVSDVLIQNIDAVPTLLDAAGLPRPDSLQGKSFWPLLTEGEYKPHDEIFIERNFHGEHVSRSDDYYEDRFDPVRSIRTRDFHYILNVKPHANRREWLIPEIPASFLAIGESLRDAWPEPCLNRNREELFHVALDTLESNDVSARPEYREVKKKLHQQLLAWMKSTDDFALGDDVPVRPNTPSWGTFEAIL